jgi:hypothetical protein
LDQSEGRIASDARHAGAPPQLRHLDHQTSPQFANRTDQNRFAEAGLPRGLRATALATQPAMEACLHDIVTGTQ